MNKNNNAVVGTNARTRKPGILIIDWRRDFSGRVIISAVLSIPQTAGGSNEYGVTTAQCLTHTQSNGSGKATVNGKIFGD